MAKVAILGFGNIGSGVLEVLRTNAQRVAKRVGQAVEVKYVCDIRDFSKHKDAKLFVNNIDVILNDDEIDVVVETIGGTNPAYYYVKSALESGRHVVSSNKELVATHGAELLRIAKDKGVCFLFEASVGGGTPIITPMYQCLAANTITGVQGIVNGTTNFMLTKMDTENMSFDDALKLAQELGFAETIDPSADVDGIDAQRKISILASLSYGVEVHPENVRTTGIRKVSVEDIHCAKEIGCAVKLIAWAKRNSQGVVACGVQPCLVPQNNLLAGVNDVFNAVKVGGDMLGDVVFYGKGAGKLPTASAVVADITDALCNGALIHDSLFWTASPAADGYIDDDANATWYVRANTTKENVLAEHPDANIIKCENGVVCFTMSGFCAKDFDNAPAFVANAMQVLA